jgi:tRNA pseudouridine38-40 synthase
VERYQIIFAYDGTHFVGSQRQAEARTVQSVLENALRQLGWDGKSILLAGRTDTGVHASGQVAAVDLEWTHATEDLRNALNANLPLDVSVKSVRRAPNRFHPRFDAISRCYRYRLYCQPVRDPLRDRFSWRVWPVVDGNLLQSAAAVLSGQHDFAAFGTPPRAGGSTVRTVMHADWMAQDDEWFFYVRADAFLYRMVRRMVYVQVAVGQGRLRVDAVCSALEGQDTLPAGLASPCGLSLVEVTYPNLDDQVEKSNLV